MTTLRQFRLDDLLKFNQINLDVLTETYNGTVASGHDVGPRAKPGVNAVAKLLGIDHRQEDFEG
jgi:hypothetical protein